MYYFHNPFFNVSNFRDVGALDCRYHLLYGSYNPIIYGLTMVPSPSILYTEASRYKTGRAP